jgi:hypothetical protein
VKCQKTHIVVTVEACAELRKSNDVRHLDEMIEVIRNQKYE